MNLVDKGLVKVELKGGNRLLPEIIIDEKMFKELCNPWEEAVQNYAAQTGNGLEACRRL